ncbi:MAG: zinc-binding dehydrogenase, partial [Candidatus Methylomirabilis sp.]|nr:zinc-binding dehydrogenase [Deltaproteobacteria bacterium]
MKAVVLAAVGGPENLELQEIATPRATPGHVVVKVGACGVSYRDIIDRRGGFAFIQTPIVLGHEFAGEIVEVGEGVAGWSVGDRALNLHRNFCGVCPHCRGGEERECSGSWEVFGLTVNGGYAEYALCGALSLERLPEALSYEVGATMMSAAAVAYHNTRNVARVGLGDRVLVTGGSGGVGAYAVQVAKLLGATVWAVTSSEKKARALRDLGADEVIVAPDGNFHKEVQRRTEGAGLDAAVENVGGPTFNSSLRSLRRGGRMVVIGNIDGKPVELNLGLPIVKSLAILGSDGVTRRALRETMGLVAEGRLRPAICETLPLAKAAD